MINNNQKATPAIIKIAHLKLTSMNSTNNHRDKKYLELNLNHQFRKRLIVLNEESNKRENMIGFFSSSRGDLIEIYKK